MASGKKHTLIARSVEGLRVFNTYKGIYSNSIVYNIGNIVAFENSFYIRINSSGSGNLPTDTNYWSVYSQ
jgi:hypothetical protein